MLQARHSLTTLTRRVATMLVVLSGLMEVSQAIAAAEGEFVNLSTRALVETGEEVMIGGFIIEDGPRRVLIQARGPELADFGISNVLADPVLTVTNTTDPDPANYMEVMVNDNWEDSQEQLLSDLWGDNPPLTAGSLSSAAVLTLERGNYTAKVEGKNGTSGIALVEVYGINSPGSDGLFVNLSTRALVKTEEEVMIGGFIIEDGPRRVLIQTRGPELANFGISNVLADPVLTVTNTTDPRNPTEMMVNDNWEDSQRQLVSDFWGDNPPLMSGSLSAAAVLLLNPGNYTARVEGKDGSAGVALIEVYRIDFPEVEITDFLALTALYRAVNGNDWDNNTNWLTVPTLSDWHGVTTDDAGRVIGLDLAENSLFGTIPAELANLSNLQYLSLAQNALSGPIPAELADLPNLKVLVLSENRMSGPIPVELSELSNLENLNLSKNELSGPIPVELADLANLTSLDLSWNNLSGTVPVELANLAKLISLDLSRNNLSGPVPVELVNLDNLTSLDLSYNELSGVIPAELAEFAKLETLNLARTHLSGPIPAELADLASLKTLSLSGPKLSGPIPTELSRLPNLEGLSLSGNLLIGPIPAELGNLASLKTLSLSGNQLSGAIPAELGRLANLEELRLSGIQLSGPIPAELGNLVNLQSLSLWQTQLSGPIPGELGNLANLHSLGLARSQLSGPIPAELGKLANLRTLDLRQNQLSGAIPPQLGNLANLQGLSLWENQFTGPIPAELGNLANLQYLILSQNQFTGPIPAELGNLANLRSLGLDRNLLKGPLPDTFLQLQQLNAFSVDLHNCAPDTFRSTGWLSKSISLSWGPPYRNFPALCTETDRVAIEQLSQNTNRSNWDNSANWLTDAPLGDWHGITTDANGMVAGIDLAGNNLTGFIPRELAALDSLKTLRLSENQLNGSIPKQLGLLVGLTELSLENNQLSGLIPAELGELPNLETINLSGNQFSGCIPNGLRRIGNNDLSELGLPFCGLQSPELWVRSYRSIDEFNQSEGLWFTLWGVVLNYGEESSAATTMRFYRSSDATISPDDTLIGTRTLSDLAASGTTRVGIYWNAPTSPGTYYYGVCVDAVPGESDATNNCSSSVQVVVK